MSQLTRRLAVSPELQDCPDCLLPQGPLSCSPFLPLAPCFYDQSPLHLVCPLLLLQPISQLCGIWPSLFIVSDSISFFIFVDTHASSAGSVFVDIHECNLLLSHAARKGAETCLQSRMLPGPGKEIRDQARPRLRSQSSRLTLMKMPHVVKGVREGDPGPGKTLCSLRWLEPEIARFSGALALVGGANLNKASSFHTENWHLIVKPVSELPRIVFL